ncbi:hypothetical protein PIB30_044155 [Stylosanthes scabra]|uniref:Uncharacterized protein n=1 Tax=Stylosanthes scabra TaxID=79078 RepID=A0ABU6VER9_9FABA|nr:hypothetical protein [Stylosanthes scabra]
MDKNMRGSRCFAVTLFDRHNSEFEATQTSPTGDFSLGTYRVSVRNMKCDCGHFQALHYPGLQRLPTTLFTTHIGGILASIWHPHYHSRSAHEESKGETATDDSDQDEHMDDVDPNRPRRYGLCRQVGHTRKNCDQRGSTAGDGV